MLHLFLKAFAHEVFLATASDKKQPKTKINKSSRKFFTFIESLLQSQLDFIAVKGSFLKVTLMQI